MFEAGLREYHNYDRANPRGERGQQGPVVPDGHLSSLIAALFTE